MRTDDQIIRDLVTDYEGKKFTWDKKRGDPPTKFGITQDTLSSWRGHAVTPEDVRDMEQPEAEAIYRALFLAPIALLIMPLRETLLHICVLRGQRAGVMMLQGMLAFAEKDIDGWVGAQTVEAVTKIGVGAVSALMCGGMLQHFALKVKSSPEKKDYHIGWRDRFLRLYHMGDNNA